LVSRSPVHCVWPETFVTGRKAPADRIQPGVMGNLKKTMQMRQIIGMILIILFFSCARIENREWKYQDGFSIGDWIEFDDVGLTIRNDTIFNKEKPIARIYDYNQRIIDQILIIEALNDTTKGYYCSKGKK